MKADPKAFDCLLAKSEIYRDYLFSIHDDSEADFLNQLFERPSSELALIIHGFLVFELHNAMFSKGMIAESNPQSPEANPILQNEILKTSSLIDFLYEKQHEASLPQDIA